ncbi:hypothetical protein ACWKW4_16540 [Hydrogenophaga borbori]
MKSTFTHFAVALALASPALAQHSAEETKADIQRHRTMAAAHEAAARCLEAGKGEKTCYEELAVTCKGLAIGKYCGMRHAH